MLTQAQLDGWKIDPVTIMVFKKLEEKIAQIKDNLGTGGSLNCSSSTETLGNTAREVGKIEGISEIFDLEV